MQDYMCTYCGAVNDMETRYEYRGEFWGTSAYEPIAVCACCGRDEFEEVDMMEQCKSCRHVKMKNLLYCECEYGLECGEYQNQCEDFEPEYEENLLEPLYGKEVF